MNEETNTLFSTFNLHLGRNLAMVSEQKRLAVLLVLRAVTLFYLVNRILEERLCFLEHTVCALPSENAFFLSSSVKVRGFTK